MADEQLMKILEEIRDLQKLHVENYKDALHNQQESIGLQKRAVRRQILFLIVVAVFLGALFFWAYSPKS
jgi:hypothetical protein